MNDVEVEILRLKREITRLEMIFDGGPQAQSELVLQRAILANYTRSLENLLKRP